MTLKEVIESAEFKKELGEYVHRYNNRDINLKRTPFDGLKDKGLFTVEALSDEFFRVDCGISDLNSSARRAVSELVIVTARRVFPIIEKARKEAQNECE